MKKILILIACILILPSGAPAQQSVSPGGGYTVGTPFDGDIAFGYRWVLQEGSSAAGEYEYLHPSLAGRAIIEYDPLPHRFLFEAFVNNEKDLFGEFDYAYSDLVMFTSNVRKIYRNLPHLSLGEDNVLTASPSITDLDPTGVYFSESTMTRAQLRLKTPDFPFHLYLEAKSFEKQGTVQQRFMRSFANGFSKASQARDIDFETTEAKITVNSHVNFLEIEYSHAVKEFGNSKDKSLNDITAVSYTHNQVSDTESSTDTIKVHTSHTGRIAAAATYSSGERENKDSGVKAEFVNAGGDFTWIPTKNLTASLKYRHHEVSQDGPATVNAVSLTGTTTYSVKDAIGYTKDAVSGYVRYRATDRLTLRAEAIYDTLSREFDPGAWALDEEITRATMRLGTTYRVTNRLMLRGDISRQTADAPADSMDNTYADTTDSARGLLTWMPSSWFNLSLSAGTVREKRDDMAAPFTGPRESERNRGQASLTFLAGKRTAIIPTYAFYQNKQTSAIAYTDAANGITAEEGVPYGDAAHVASLAMTHALTDNVTLTADGTRTWSRGSWLNAGTVAGSTGIADLSSLKLIETEVGGEVQVRYSKNVGTELRYRYRELDDRLDDAEDGTVQLILATLTVAW